MGRSPYAEATSLGARALLTALCGELRPRSSGCGAWSPPDPATVRGDLGMAGNCTPRELPWAPRLPRGRSHLSAQPGASPASPAPRPPTPIRARPSSPLRQRCWGGWSVPGQGSARSWSEVQKLGSPGAWGRDRRTPRCRVSARLQEQGSPTLLGLSPQCALPGTSTPVRSSRHPGVRGWVSPL